MLCLNVSVANKKKVRTQVNGILVDHADHNTSTPMNHCTPSHQLSLVSILVLPFFRFDNIIFFQNPFGGNQFRLESRCHRNKIVPDPSLLRTATPTTGSPEQPVNPVPNWSLRSTAAGTGKCRTPRFATSSPTRDRKPVRPVRTSFRQKTSRTFPGCGRSSRPTRSPSFPGSSIFHRTSGSPRVPSSDWVAWWADFS